MKHGFANQFKHGTWLHKKVKLGKTVKADVDLRGELMVSGPIPFFQTDKILPSILVSSK